MKRLILVLFAFAFALLPLASENFPPQDSDYEYDFELSDIAKRILPVLQSEVYVNIKSNMREDSFVWKEGRSSALVEEGKRDDFYEINRINDMKVASRTVSYEHYNSPHVRKTEDITSRAETDTAWVEGADGDGIGEWVMIPVDEKNYGGALSQGYYGEKLKLSLTMHNGYQKNADLYKKNGRVKDARITVYAAAYDLYECVKYYETFTRRIRTRYLLWNPECVAEEEVTFSDEIDGKAAFLNTDRKDFEFFLPEKYMNKSFKLFVKLEILGVYKGTKYSDTCISDLTAVAHDADY